MQTDIAVTRQLDPFNPALKRTQEMPQGTSLQTCFDDLAYVVPEHQDLVLFLNAKPVMRAQWDYKIQSGDHVLIKPYPRGGDGGGLRQVAQIGLSAAAMYVGGPAGAAIMLGGSLAMNEFMPIPVPPTPQNTQPFSNTYQSQSRGNVPKPMQPKPEQFGEIEIYPDEGARSYFAYENNQQVYYQLLAIGMGDYEIDTSTIKMASEPFLDYENSELEFVPKGGTLTLVNPSVTTVETTQIEVPDQTLNIGYKWINGGGDGDAQQKDLTVGHFTSSSRLHFSSSEVYTDGWLDVSVGDTIRLIDNSGVMSDPMLVAHVFTGAYTYPYNIQVDDSNVTSAISNYITSRGGVVPTDNSSNSVSGIWPIKWDTAESAINIDAELFTIDSNKQISIVQIDFALPQNANSFTVAIDVRPIDKNNVPSGGWQAVESRTLISSASEIKYTSESFNVPYGRYQVRAYRTDFKTSAGDQLFIQGVKGIADSEPNSIIAEDCTLLALKVQVPLDQNITLGETRVVAKRKLPWLMANGEWSTPVASNSISGALAEALRIRYGDQFENYLMPLDELYALQQTWSSRGDTFNGRFDQQIVLKEAMQLIARAGRAIALEIGDRWYFVRDEPGVATYPYSPANIIANPDTAEPVYSIQHKYPLANDPDGIVVEFFNRDVWEWDETPSYPTDALQPKRIRFFGITDKQHAWRECCYLYYREIIKPSTVTFRTELEALNHGFGDLLSIAPPKSTVYGAGVIENYDAGTQTLELSEPLEWSDTGYHFLNLRRDDGTTSGPYEVSQGDDDYHCVFKPGTSLDLLPHNGYSQTPQREPTHYQFGKTSTGFLARLTGRKQTSSHEFELTAEIVNPLAHTIDQTPYPS